MARAAREGRRDILEVFRERNYSIALGGVDELICACALGDEALAQSLAEKHPALRKKLVEMGGTLLTKFSAGGSLAGVRILLPGTTIRALTEAEPSTAK